ncbi:chaperonin 10-like protein [Boeremia exigua]|uniref:chaperonin 10-like protein n=1 Tax=Boeremia exigua TaxID=749465 RepID=UPI001E8CD77E|nr:chaperonin 10-like protein [Boeremia exigua]KAH6619896.1 chaperonin 10-like protein [Boeremia exigua]
MQALISIPKDKSVVVQEVPKPKPGPTEILVKVHAVALNHVDAIYAKFPIAAQDVRTIGSDFAGEVVEIGADLQGITDPRAIEGARVAGFVQGACSVNERPGAFAEYLAIDMDLTWSVPDQMPYEDAATISLCGLTAAQAVFDRLQLPCPFRQTEGFGGLTLKPNELVNVFIYGATSSLGLYAAQLVRKAEQASGTKVRLLGAASAAKHAQLQQTPYNYDVLVDYKDPEWPIEIRKATGKQGGVQYALDAVSQGQTVSLVESTIGVQGRFAAFRSPALGGFRIDELRIKPILGAVWEGLGAEIVYQGGAVIPANSEARQFAAEFYKYLGLVGIVPNPTRRMSGGLANIPNEGFSLLGAWGDKEATAREHLRPISGEKIVYTVS